jgi:hypothetical protein
VVTGGSIEAQALVRVWIVVVLVGEVRGGRILEE